MSDNRFWTFMRIMNVRLRFIFLMVLVGLVVGYWENITNYYDRWTRPKSVVASAHDSNVEYYCPMHPHIIRDDPGNCPICGMPLSERAKGGKVVLPPGVLARVQMTPQKVAIGRIETSPVEYRLLSREIRTVGQVDYDETRRAFIAARFAGRIEKAFVNSVGSSVKKGDPLVSIYSPDLLVAQEELLTAARGANQQKGGSDLAASAAQSMVEAARRKLQLWGITAEQIDEIIRKGAPQTAVTVYSPMAGIVTEKRVLEGRYVEQGTDLYTIADLSRVWMQVQIFEDQIAGIKTGTAVLVTSNAHPEEAFAGRITFIAYTVDPATRTVAARLEIDNPDYKLKPGMYATAVIRLPAGAVTEIASVSGPHSASAPAGDMNMASAPEQAPDQTQGGRDARLPLPTTKPAASGAGYATDDLANAFVSLASAFAHDKTDDVALARLTDAAKALGEKGPASIRSQAAEIAKELAPFKGKDLKEQRKLLKPLSTKLVDLIKASPPGETLHIAYCPMVKAPWLQTGKAIENPFYGSDMFDCGVIQETIEPKGGVDDGRSVTGYWCPVTPDRLFDAPEQCPLDQFPMKFAKLEKVLAVPASAVIDTGTRKVAYIQTAPETFDMVELKLGHRAGEFFPVLSGLKAEDRVATNGAFLVDAENRLNPAASAQYFGASGSPKKE